MSSTSRGGQRSDADFYSTPQWCTRRLLEMLRLPSGDWLEPCAGTGAIVKAASHLVPIMDWTLVELRDECRAALLQVNEVRDDERLLCPMDFFTWAKLAASEPELHKFQVTLTNPPFSSAMDFIQACRKISEHSIFLLRLNFLGAEERANFMRETKPDLYILPERPEFAASLSCGEKPKCGFTRVQGVKEPRPNKCPGCGKKLQVSTTDSISYAFFHWWPGSTGKYVLLDSTPLEERKRG